MMNERATLEAYRLAKKARGLADAEKQALIAIADAHSMRDQVCRKSVSTLHADFGISDRRFRYGIRGRKRADGSLYFPGLLRRGIVHILSGGRVKDGVPTVYKVDLAALRAFVEQQGTSAQTSAQDDGDLCTTAPRTSAQSSENLCTVADKLPLTVLSASSRPPRVFGAIPRVHKPDATSIAPEERQRRKDEKQKRLTREAGANREAHIGEGPSLDLTELDAGFHFHPEEPNTAVCDDCGAKMSPSRAAMKHHSYVCPQKPKAAAR
jgi:hypothetical protein